MNDGTERSKRPFRNGKGAHAIGTEWPAERWLGYCAGWRAPQPPNPSPIRRSTPASPQAGVFFHRAVSVTKKARNPASRVVPMGANHLIVPAIKQAISMLGQAREALIFAQCPTAVAKVRQAIKSTQGALCTARRRVQVASSGLGQFGQFFFFNFETRVREPPPRRDANLGVHRAIQPYSWWLSLTHWNRRSSIRVARSLRKLTVHV